MREASGDEFIVDPSDRIGFLPQARQKRSPQIARGTCEGLWQKTPFLVYASCWKRRFCFSRVNVSKIRANASKERLHWAHRQLNKCFVGGFWRRVYRWPERSQFLFCHNLDKSALQRVRSTCEGLKKTPFLVYASCWTRFCFVGRLKFERCTLLLAKS